jgi:hypothetical protein
MGALLVVGCSRSSEGPTAAPSSSVSPAAGAVTPDASTTDAVRALPAFAWKVDVTKPSYEVEPILLSGARGNVPVGVAGWTCTYRIEPARTRGATRDQSGYLSCERGAGGPTASTMVLCQEASARPADCGTGSLRLAGADGRVHSLSMSCRSASVANDCWERARVVERPSAALSGTSVTGATTPGTLGARNGPPATGADAGAIAGRLHDADGSLHFTWKINVAGAAGTSLSPRDGSGALATGLPGFDCSYSIATQRDAVYSQLEIGHVSCRMKSTGDKVEGTVLCAENEKRTSACNVGSLSLTDGAVSRDILMSCRGPSNRCFD